MSDLLFFVLSRKFSKVNIMIRSKFFEFTIRKCLDIEKR